MIRRVSALPRRASPRSTAEAISLDVASIHAAESERSSTIFEVDSAKRELCSVRSPAEELLHEDRHAAVREERESVFILGRSPPHRR